ncbi:uncharacterized protein LOC108277089 isoform X1 [Ictalurus punctatus]|uniref:Uncharacterized protein LOC108277089 isoform X1 n=1 Tax=Ictalurus punctatus TaxID=7998 RepID=A0A2D0SR16_ICTPU|nr:uncharacterized protein LOC108277089 isoform X1 [Ictalurus punctatus]
MWFDLALLIYQGRSEFSSLNFVLWIFLKLFHGGGGEYIKVMGFHNNVRSFRIGNWTGKILRPDNLLSGVCSVQGRSAPDQTCRTCALDCSKIATSGRACDTFPEPCYIRNRKLRSHLVQHAGLGTPYVLMLSPDVKRRVLLTEVCDFPQKSSWST